MSRWRVVVGIDGSAAAGDALAWAMSLAAERDGEVYVVHAWRPAGLEPAECSRQGRDRAEDLLIDSIASVRRPPGVAVISHAVEGDPGSALVHAAGRADLLVLGRIGTTELGVGRRCRRLASCPVQAAPDSYRWRVGASAHGEAVGLVQAATRSPAERWDLRPCPPRSDGEDGQDESGIRIRPRARRSGGAHVGDRPVDPQPAAVALATR